MNITEKVYIAIISVIFGSIVGFLTKYYFNRIAFRQKLLEEVVSRYLNAKDSICALIADCATLEESIDNEWLSNKNNELSKIYYKHYDYIPLEILKSLICFQACLADKNNRIYSVNNNRLTICDDKKVANMSKRISIIDNLNIAIMYNLNNTDIKEKQKNRLKFQARCTISDINKYFTEDNLRSISIFKPKH